LDYTIIGPDVSVAALCGTRQSASRALTRKSPLTV
jgi:hypothetical protein